MSVKMLIRRTLTLTLNSRLVTSAFNYKAYLYAEVSHSLHCLRNSVRLLFFEVIAIFIVSVVISKLNSIFDYTVPEDLKSFIKKGVRVVVPLGRYNRQCEAVVVSLSEENSADYNLKSIIEVIDYRPYISEELLHLAEYLRDFTFCTYYTALRTVMPPRAETRFFEWYYLSEGLKSIDTSSLDGDEKLLAEQIVKAGGKIELRGIRDIKNKRLLLSRMLDKGFLRLEKTNNQKLRHKFVKTVSLCITKQQAETLIPEIVKRAPVQAKVLSVLIETGSLALSEFKNISSSASAAVYSLCKRGAVKVEQRQIVRHVINQNIYRKTEPYIPTQEQAEVIEQLKKLAKSGKYKSALLHGVTGSGKTEVFLQIIEYILSCGKRAVVLVPEISLTPQMIERFSGRFPGEVAVLHSSLSPGERFDEWHKVYEGTASVVIGTRSAVFAPVENLGVIIIDEEHENTYKSEANPKYHARDIALWRAEYNKALLVLASATPDVVSYSKAAEGIHVLLKLKKRYNDMAMPKVITADMRRELELGNRSMFSITLKREIEKNLCSRQQSILFLNRRGFSTFVSCRSCGESIGCPDCSVTLTYHKNVNKLVCHYCGYSVENPKICPSCMSPYIRYFGDGTQKIEEEIKMLFPGATFLRMDTDTTTGKNSHQAILDRFENEKIDLLIGTQMVAKGLDFKNVTLVGVMAADMSLNFQDYRAYERSFSLFTQVFGRAGRGNVQGRAVIQSYQPGHFVINLAKTHDYESFYRDEILARKQFNNPPFCDIIMVMAEGLNDDKVKMKIECVYNFLRRIGNVYPPCSAPLGRIKKRYRYRVIAKTQNLHEVFPLLRELSDKFSNNSEVSVNIDINPSSFV